MKVEGRALPPGLVNRLYRDTEMQKRETTLQTARGNSLELSSRAREMAELRAKAVQEPEVRGHLVQSIKQRLNQGSYRVDPEKLAAAMLVEQER